jgi:hypothetical protein
VDSEPSESVKAKGSMSCSKEYYSVLVLSSESKSLWSKESNDRSREGSRNMDSEPFHDNTSKESKTMDVSRTHDSNTKEGAQPQLIHLNVFSLYRANMLLEYCILLLPFKVQGIWIRGLLVTASDVSFPEVPEASFLFIHPSICPSIHPFIYACMHAYTHGHALTHAHTNTFKCHK